MYLSEQEIESQGFCAYPDSHDMSHTKGSGTWALRRVVMMWPEEEIVFHH